MRRDLGLKQTQRLIQKMTRLTIETGMLTGQEIALVIFYTLDSDQPFQLYTAAVAIINLVLFLIPSKATYFQTTIGVLGKMYSNTLMVLLNSRMTYGARNDTISIELSTEASRMYFSSQAGVSVTYESDSAVHQLEDSKR
jgi:hypothetical protein